jgi:hypothetical protein
MPCTFASPLQTDSGHLTTLDAVSGFVDVFKSWTLSPYLVFHILQNRSMAHTFTVPFHDKDVRQPLPVDAAQRQWFQA